VVAEEADAAEVAEAAEAVEEALLVAFFTGSAREAGATGVAGVAGATAGVVTFLTTFFTSGTLFIIVLCVEVFVEDILRNFMPSIGGCGAVNFLQECVQSLSRDRIYFLL
jgi:hypothetical protein